MNDTPEDVETGFVFALQLDGSGGAQNIKRSEITPKTTWVHIDYSGRDSSPLLRELGLSQFAVEALTRTETRPRGLRMDGAVILFLRGVNMNPGDDPEDMVSLRFWIERDRVITVRQRRLFSVQDVRDALDQGRGPADVNGIVSELVERIADRIADFVDRLETTIDEFETAVSAQSLGAIRSNVSRTRRQVAQVRRYLAPQRDALESVARDPPEYLTKSVRAIREQSDRIMRNVEDLDLARERAIVLQEEILNRIAEEQNSRMYVLSIVALIFLPITFITGLFGMNVAGLPGTEGTSAFWIATAVMAVSAALTVLWLKLKRWF